MSAAGGPDDYREDRYGDDSRDELPRRSRNQGEAQGHPRPGSREAEAAVRDFEAENP
ncbi:hypothetical protein [Saccharothrix syringae]|uniref:hypothetical protein n=1 Tax=Saccharothrix syringae TaxID=103733 RepID=UPI0012933283|nr:hypothetical protein [Saccharothrix syringae]